MKKPLMIVLALALVAILAYVLVPLLQKPAPQEKVLNLMTWESYIDDETIANFEKETGIKVVYSPMETNEDLQLKLSMSGGTGFDLILGSDYMLDILRKENLIQKLDKSKLSNFNNLDSLYLNQYFDPASEYVIPYSGGSPLIVYDPAKVDFEITGYEDFWNESLKDSLAIMGDARMVVGLTLKTMGKSFNETDPAVLEEARAKLMTLAPNILTLEYNNLQAALLSGEAKAGFLFTTQVFLATLEHPDLKVVYPKEGLGIGIDGLAIPAKAEHADNALLFLDYLMRPEVAAFTAMWQGGANFNKAAVEHLSADYVNNLAFSAPEAMVESAEYIQDIGETATLFQEIYTDFTLQ